MKKIHTFDAVFDAQKMFRILLTALSKPGKIQNILEHAGKLHGDNPSLLALAMTLLDNEVTFSTCGNEELTGEIISLTLSKSVALAEADYIFVTDSGKLRGAVEEAKCGTLRDPHTSATLIIQTNDTMNTLLRLVGPGIKDVAELQGSATVLEALRLRDAQCYEYPQGIDIIFISDNGDLFAVPRLVRLEA